MDETIADIQNDIESHSVFFDRTKEIIEVLSRYQKIKPLKIVFHCFTGTTKLRNFCLDYEFYISLSGIVTFKNAIELNNISELPRSFFNKIEKSLQFL